MLQVHDGQCSLGAYFGENNTEKVQLIQIRLEHEAPADLTESYGHPKVSPLDLVVTPISGCNGFEPVEAQA